MAKARLYSNAGEYKSDIDLPDSHFSQEINTAVLHQAVNIYLGNQRQGTSKTKSRSEVSGGGKKPWKQKGTGRARSGSNTSPIWARGGKAHGPTPRSYTRRLNTKARRGALLSALSIKANESSVHVFEGFSLDVPKTKVFAGILSNASLADRKTMIYVSSPEPNLILAVRNIPAVNVGRVQDMNAYDVLNAQSLIFTESAIAALSAKAESNAKTVKAGKLDNKGESA